MLSTIIASSASSGIAMAIGGIVCVLALSAVFYVVGRGEDREREHAAAARAAAEDEPPEPPAAEEPHPRLPAAARTRRRR